MIHTQSEIDNLVELAIIQRAELKKLVDSLPQLRDHLSSEIERNLEEIEPAIRTELEEFVTARALDAHAKTSIALTAKIDELARSLETTTAARYSVLIAEREKNASLLAQAEARIAEAASALPSAVAGMVTEQLARFPRAGEIDQLRKEFAEPKGLNPRGKWSPNETYQRLDLVTFNGDSFVSNIDGNRERPSRSAADWTLNAARGNSGGGGSVTSIIDLIPAPSAGQILGSVGPNYVPKNLVAGANITITETDTDITITGDEGQIELQDGTAAAPSLFFVNDIDTGLFRPGSNELGMSVGGVQQAAISSTTFSITPNLVVSGTGTINGTTIPASKTLVVTTDKISALAATTSAELAGVISDETGTGSLVFANSPTLVTPALGTPSALVGTNITGTAAGLTAGNAATATALATGRTITITGDLAYTSPTFDGTGNVTAAGTLATVATPGSTGSSTAIPIITINAKGLTTSISTAAVVAPAGTLSGNTLASGVTASSLTSLGTIANLAATAGTISTTPSGSTDIANKLYVDTVAQGLDAKASCVAATTADITLSGAQTIDGVSVIAGDRVLVKNQTLSQNNGIYLCASGAWTRTSDADTWDELTSAFTFIEQGTTNADTGYVCTANAGGTLGTTALPWSQFSGAGTFTAGTGLTLTGSVFSLTSPVAVANGGTGLTSLGSGVATFLGTPSSANLAAAVTDETGSGALVFATSPTLVTPALGTPSAIVLTNASGTASININGTVGATTPTTGVFTALTVNDNSTLGSSNTDTVNFNARVASDINPSTDDTFDLGVTGHEWRNLNIDGTANIDSLVADTADVNGGTIDATAIGATTPSTGAFTTISGTTSALVSNNGDTSSANYPSVSTRLGSSFDGQNIMTMLAYGANTAIVQGVAGGTKASPTQTTSGSGLMILGGYGYNTTNGWGGGTGTSNARIAFAATEDHTNTAQGAKISFDVTPNTTASRITAMTIDQSGNVGIGTTSPNTILHLERNVSGLAGLNIYNPHVTGNPGIIIRNAGSGSAGGGGMVMYYSGNDFHFRNDFSNRMFFGNSGLQQVMIDATGNVGIGTSSFGTSAAKVLGIADGTAPTSSPAGMGQIYVEAGALKYRGSSGTVTTIANA